MYDLITDCLTTGRLPDLLRYALDSLGPLKAMKTPEVNDFGNEQTPDVSSRSWSGGFRSERPDTLHGQWHSYSRIPHLARNRLLESPGGSSKCESMRHLRRQASCVALMQQPTCHQSGEGLSFVTQAPTRSKKIKNRFTGIKLVG